MALGAAKAAGADSALSVTGIAGPGGGTGKTGRTCVYRMCKWRGNGKRVPFYRIVKEPTMRLHVRSRFAGRTFKEGVREKPVHSGKDELQKNDHKKTI